MWHDTMSASGSYGVRGDLQPGVHIENAETKRRLKNLLDAYEVTPRLQALPFTEATDQDLLRFHTAEYVEKVQKLSDAQGGDAGEHMPFGPGSVDIARLAVGGTTSAINAVAKGEVDNAYSLTRPPGHHAERDRDVDSVFSITSLWVCSQHWKQVLSIALRWLIGMSTMAMARNRLSMTDLTC